MPRIAGVDIPNEKKLIVALTYICGIGSTLSRKVLEKTGIDPGKRAKELTSEEVSKLSAGITREFTVEGDLRREHAQNIKRLMDIGSYRGLRHKKGLPVRGQRTHTNARTRKGPRRAVGIKVKRSVKA